MTSIDASSNAPEYGPAYEIRAYRMPAKVPLWARTLLRLLRVALKLAEAAPEDFLSVV